MAKLAKYLLITSGLLLLFYFGGVITQDYGGITINLLKILLDPENISWNSLLSSITLGSILTIVAATGIAIAALAFQRPDMVILAPIVMLFRDLILALVDIYNQIPATFKPVGVLIFAPIIVLLFMVMIDWWRGVDQ